MGVNPNTFVQLAEFSGRYRINAPSLMLGRQKFRLGRYASRRRMKRARDLYRPGVQLDDLFQADGYAERMFEGLGFPGMETLDASDWEFPDGELKPFFLKLQKAWIHLMHSWRISGGNCLAGLAQLH